MSISKKNTAVISVVGCDRVGIIAGVSTLLSENGINIKDIHRLFLKKYLQ
ncbi:MAG: ACT domain-containing protein [Saccharofermentanales bacterium]